jgi:hypothetical protein
LLLRTVRFLAFSRGRNVCWPAQGSLYAVGGMVSAPQQGQGRPCRSKKATSRQIVALLTPNSRATVACVPRVVSPPLTRRSRATSLRRASARTRRTPL